MTTSLTLGRDYIKVAEPVHWRDEDKEWLHHVFVQKGIGMVFQVGSNRPGSYTVSNGISNEAARILARWILDNL